MKNERTFLLGAFAFFHGGATPMSAFSTFFRLLLFFLASITTFLLGNFVSRQASAAPPSTRPSFRSSLPASPSSLFRSGDRPLRRPSPISPIPPTSSASSASASSKALQRFYQAEEQRHLFLKRRYSGHSEQDRLIHQQMIDSCRKLQARYSRVFETSPDPRLRLAASYRRTEILHLLLQKLVSAPPPRDLPRHLHSAYRSALEGMIQSYEEDVLTGYRQILRLSQIYQIYNRWSCLAEKNLSLLQGFPPPKTQCNGFPF